MQTGLAIKGALLFESHAHHVGPTMDRALFVICCYLAFSSDIVGPNLQSTTTGPFLLFVVIF